MDHWIMPNISYALSGIGIVFMTGLPFFLLEKLHEWYNALTAMTTVADLIANASTVVMIVAMVGFVIILFNMARVMGMKRF